MVTTDKVTVTEFAPYIGKTTTDYKENDMGVYIPNMSKPKGCKDCQWHLDFYIEDEQVGGLCTITEKDDKENICPLIEIDLVRCEECKYVGTDATCCLVCCRDGMGLKPYHVYHDDFCSYGERRTDEN